MKTLIIHLLLIAALVQGHAQTNWKKYAIAGSSALMSGMLDGTIESISFHYQSGFKSRFPNANNQFWNPELSWRNKYKNGDPAQGPKFTGSTTVFAFTGDAYHMLRTSKRALDAYTLVYFINEDSHIKSKKAKRKTMLKDFVILTAIRCAGFQITYACLFKPVKS